MRKAWKDRERRCEEIIGHGFIKGGILGNEEMARRRMITTIPFLGRRVANDDTPEGPRVKFVAWNLTIRSKTHTAKHTWDEIGT